jgi:hypothetical protein
MKEHDNKNRREKKFIQADVLLRRKAGDKFADGKINKEVIKTTKNSTNYITCRIEYTEEIQKNTLKGDLLKNLKYREE